MSIQYAFLFDQSRCMACNACTVACKDWNQLNPGLVNWRTQYTHEVKNGAAPEFYPLSMGCNHCEEPACMKACTVNAITKDEQGAVIVDRTKCMGLQLCISQCPYAKPQIADDKQESKKADSWIIAHPMQKCDMCSGRREKGEKPLCVTSCIGRALTFGPLSDIEAIPGAVRLNKGQFPYAYKNAAADETKPSFFIKPRKEMKISKSSGYTGKITN